MTCFSIQKFALFGLFLLSLSAAPPPAGALEKMLNSDGSLMSEEEIKQSQRVDQPIVLELFTASDCSACVIADRLLYDAMKDKNVIALSCHMQDLTDTGETGRVEKKGKDAGRLDGPMDPCVFRQWAYKASGRREDVAINIPEFIFNGNFEIGVDNMPLFYRAVDMFHYSSRNKTLEVMMRWKDKNTLTIGLPQAPESRFGLNTASVWLVRYKDMEIEKIESGVNKGKVLRFSNIIQDITHITKWRGVMRSFDLDVAPPKGGNERGGYAILVQESMGKPMLAAGKISDYPMPNDIKREVPTNDSAPTAPVRGAPVPAPKSN